MYAVEAGSAGEAIAKENGYTYNAVSSQADALMEVASGTSEAAIIDLLMAGAMIGEGTSYPDLTYTDRLTEEEYGVGCRQDSDLTDYINTVFAEAYADGTMAALADTYAISQDLLVEQSEPAEFTPAEDGDVAYIQDKGTLIVGITEFAPMDYKDENGEWIGFDADLAKLVAEKTGRGSTIRRHRLGQQDHGAEFQKHRCGMERHDADRRSHFFHELHQRLLQKRSGGHHRSAVNRFSLDSYLLYAKAGEPPLSAFALHSNTRM